MGEAAVPIDKNAVTIVDGVVYISSLVEADVEVVGVIAEAEDRVEATRQCLRIGARAARVAHVSVDSDLVEKRFDEVTARMDAGVQSAVAQITDATASLLDDDQGALTRALQSHSSELDALFGRTFDPDSKKSVFGVLEAVLADARKVQVEEIRKLVSADGEDSPIAVAKREIVRSVHEELQEMRREVHELSERVAVNDAVADVYEITSAKGFKFEEVLYARLCDIAAPHGDVVEHVGNELGLAGTQKGDVTVKLNRDDVHGLEACVTLEAKTRKLNRRSTHEELESAIANRGAAAGVAVFSSQALAPSAVPFSYADNKAIVVLDRDGTDTTSLQLAYMWARWVARRSISATARDQLDHERIAALIADATRAITRAREVKKFHTSAKKSIDQAGAQVAALASEVQDALTEIAAEIEDPAD